MRQLTDEDVYKYFLGDITIGELYNSPIPGRKDDTPSFKLFEATNSVTKEKQLRWFDFGLTNQKEEIGTGVENLVACLRGFPTGVHDSYERKKGYAMAKSLIEKEVKIGMIGKPPTQFKKRTHSDSVAYIPAAIYEDFELEYWYRYGITKDDLLYEDIHPVREMRWENTGNISHSSKPGDPVFIYWWRRNPASYKIYRPLGPKRDKFLQRSVDGVIEGFNTLQKAQRGLIVSSTKDRLVVKKAFAGEITSVNPKGESDKHDLVLNKDKLLSFAPVWDILYDADEPGYVGSKVLAEQFNDSRFKAYDVRNKLQGQKDFSDFVDTQRGNHSYTQLVNLINGIIR